MKGYSEIKPNPSLTLKPKLVITIVQEIIA